MAGQAARVVTDNSLDEAMRDLELEGHVIQDQILAIKAMSYAISENGGARAEIALSKDGADFGNGVGVGSGAYSAVVAALKRALDSHGLWPGGEVWPTHIDSGTQKGIGGFDAIILTVLRVSHREKCVIGRAKDHDPIRAYAHALVMALDQLIEWSDK